MLEYALLTLLASFALNPDELVEELRQCRAIQDNLVRLHCYDRTVASLGMEQGEQASIEGAEESAPSTGERIVKTEAKPVEPEPVEPKPMEPEPMEPAASTGQWILKTETNPTDGTTTAWATLPAVETGSGHRGPVDLVLRCQSNQTSISINWGEYLRSDSPSVTTRLDSHPPVTAKWSRSPDKRASIYTPLGGRKIREEKIKRFALELLGAKQLAARVIPQGGSSVTAVFELSGVAAVLKSVREPCGW